MVLNIPLFLYGLRKQGVVFTIYAIYTVVVYSFGAWLITDVLPVDVSIVSPLAGSDLLLCAIFGGLISRYRKWYGDSVWRSDGRHQVLAVIFAKRLGITVGTFVMAYNLVLYIICGFVIHSWILPLYSIVTYGAALKTGGLYCGRSGSIKAATIVTVHPDEVCAALSEAFEWDDDHRGEGILFDSLKTVVYIVANRFSGKMKELVHENDRSAYISIAEIADVYGANTDKV